MPVPIDENYEYISWQLLFENSSFLDTHAMLVYYLRTATIQCAATVIKGRELEGFEEDMRESPPCIQNNGISDIARHTASP